MNLAETSFVHDRHCFDELVERAALLRSDLNDSPGLFLNLANQFAFVDRQCQRLFAVDIFAGVHGFNQWFGVPVIGSRDVNDFDVVAFQHLSIIRMHGGFATTEFVVGLLSATGIGIRNGDQIQPLFGGPEVSASHAAGTDQTDVDLVVGDFVGQRTRRPSEVRRHGRGTRGRFQNRSTVCGSGFTFGWILVQGGTSMGGKGQGRNAGPIPRANDETRQTRPQMPLL